MYEDDLIELDHEAVTIKQVRHGLRTRRIRTPHGSGRD